MTTATSAVLKMVGYLSGLSSPSVTDSKHDAKVLAEIVRRRTDEVADVLDEQEIELLERPVGHGVFDHRRLEVAERAGRDLPDRRTAPGQALRVVVGREIADHRRHPVTLAEPRQRLLQQRWSCRPRDSRRGSRTNTPGVAESRAERARDFVVLLQNAFSDFDEAGHRIHADSSSATTSISRPRTTVLAGVPHAAQENDCSEVDLSFGTTGRTEDRDRDILDEETRSLERRLLARHVERGQQRSRTRPPTAGPA